MKLIRGDDSQIPLLGLAKLTDQTSPHAVAKIDQHLIVGSEPNGAGPRVPDIEDVTLTNGDGKRGGLKNVDKACGLGIPTPMVRMDAALQNS